MAADGLYRRTRRFIDTTVRLELTGDPDAWIVDSFAWQVKGHRDHVYYSEHKIFARTIIRGSVYFMGIDSADGGRSLT